MSSTRKLLAAGAAVVLALACVNALFGGGRETAWVMVASWAVLIITVDDKDGSSYGH